MKLQKTCQRVAWPLMILLVSISSLCGVEYDRIYAVDARAMGMGRTGVASIRGAKAIYTNPGAMGLDNKFSIYTNLSISASPEHADWGDEQFFAIKYPISRNHVIAVSAHIKKNIYIDGDLKEIFLGYANSIIQGEMALGITARYLTTEFEGDGYRLSVGLVYQISEQFSFGTAVFSRAKLNVGSSRYTPYYARSGFLYTPIRWINLGMEIEAGRSGKERKGNDVFRIHYGLEFNLPVQLIWRAGKDLIDLKIRSGTYSGISEKEKSTSYIWKKPWEEGGLSCGIGMVFKFTYPKIEMDFAQDEFKRTVIGVSLNF